MPGLRGMIGGALTCLVLNPAAAQNPNTGTPKTWPSLAERLREKATLRIERQPLHTALGVLGERVDVSFVIEDEAWRLRRVEAWTYEKESVSAILGELLARTGLRVVLDPAGRSVFIVDQDLARSRGWTPEPLDELSIPTRLKKLAMTDFQGIRASGALSFLFRQSKVRYVVLEEDLQAAGISLETKVTLKTPLNTTAGEALFQVLQPLRLCVVLDETEAIARITTLKAANARGWKPLILKEPHPNTWY